MTFAVNSCTPVCKNLPYTPRSFEKVLHKQKKEPKQKEQPNSCHERNRSVYFFLTLVVLLVLYYLRTKLA